ncbi:MAG TPA: hypothetical protein DEF27_09920 [Oscillatoriales bacterium UBA8482]|nr:MAG: hypothetical protein AUK43_07015 [Oscillatoriales cyanobacterium CG2_30_40_61]HBW58091.1 hypothetical protein [Oscillatoriales bacterium UBA8482]
MGRGGQEFNCCFEVRSHSPQSPPWEGGLGGSLINTGEIPPSPPWEGGDRSGIIVLNGDNLLFKVPLGKGDLGGSNLGKK